MTERRSTYFAFQGLFLAVLLLIFLYQYQISEDWLPRFAFLVGLLGASLVLLRTASVETLSRWWFQAGLFIGDAALASLTLHWSEPQSDLYLIYFLIIFGTALTRSLAQSFIVAAVTSVLYLLSAWHPARGFPHDTAFWLRVLFLITSSALLAILARDAQQAQADQENKYHGRLVQAERLATLGQVAGEVAHRIKGPLTTIMVNAEVLSLRHAKSRDVVRELREIQQEAGHCKEILKNLLDLGRIEEIDFAPVDLRDPVRYAQKTVEPQIRRMGIRYKATGLDAALPVLGDQSLLQEAIAGVLQNAVEAVARGGRIHLKVRKAQSVFHWSDPRDLYVLTIEDNGKGIPATELEKVFQPFFTTKSPSGSGLGLSAALRILQKHNGTIEAYSEGAGRGTRITLTLPRAPGAASRTRSG